MTLNLLENIDTSKTTTNIEGIIQSYKYCLIAIHKKKNPDLLDDYIINSGKYQKSDSSKREFINHFEKAFNILEKKERELLYKYYFEFADKTIEELSYNLNYSINRMYQLKKKYLIKLAFILNEEKYKEK